MKNPEIINYKKNNYKCSFTLKNVFTGYSNAIRRIGNSEIPIVAFKPEPYHQSDINIIKNTSSLHNEFLQDRISLIPLNIDLKDINKYSFKLHKKSTDQDITVTSNDFIIHNNETNTDFKNGDIVGDKTIEIFKKDDITKEYPIICYLKQIKGNDIEEIELNCIPSIGIGKDHARFVSCCLLSYNYSNVSNIDEIKNNYILNNKNSNSNTDPAKYFDIYEKSKKEYIQVDDNLNPISFDFNLESIGILDPDIIINRSLVILKYKLNNLNKKITKITRSDTLMNGFDIYIENEDHTIGNLLETYIFQLYKIQTNENDKFHIKYVAYKKPHPLENIIILRIHFTNENNMEFVDEFLYKNIIPRLLSITDNIIDNWKNITNHNDDFNDDLITL